MRADRDAAPSATDNPRSSRRCGRETPASRRKTRALRPDPARTRRPPRLPVSSMLLRLVGGDLTRGLPASLLRNCDCEVGPVRGAQVAGGDWTELVRPRPLAIPVLA